MRRHLIASAVILSVACLAPLASAEAAPCKDAKGKFIKCPPPAPAKAVRCKKAGKFAKCGTPGAIPVK